MLIICTGITNNYICTLLLQEDDTYNFHIQQYEYHSPEQCGYEQANSYTIYKYHIHEEFDKAPKTKFEY